MDIQLYLSFSKKDHVTGYKLYNDLEKVVTPKTRDDVPGGQRIETAVIKIIKESRYFIPLFSQSLSDDSFFYTELNNAIKIASNRPHNKAFLIPANIDQTKEAYEEKLGGDFQYVLQWVDLSSRAYNLGLKLIYKAIIADLQTKSAYKISTQSIDKETAIASKIQEIEAAIDLIETREMDDNYIKSRSEVEDDVETSLRIMDDELEEVKNKMNNILKYKKNK